jgi:hypothetical protein
MLIGDIAPQARFWVTTSPVAVREIGLILAALPRARIVLVTRDPLDCGLEILFRPFGVGVEYAFDPEDVAAMVGAHWTMASHWREVFGARILNLRYEDMVADPAAAARALYGHCGIDRDPADVKMFGYLGHSISSDRVGHAGNYDPYIGDLRAALEKAAPEAMAAAGH